MLLTLLPISKYDKKLKLITSLRKLEERFHTDKTEEDQER